MVERLRGKLKILTLFGAIFLFSTLGIAQKINRNDFYEADMALVSNDYERAQKYYEKLVKAAPDNASLNFLNGLCLINLPGRKKESLKFLEIAAPKASADYVYGDPDEENAPIEAIKYYAIACKLNDDIPKAIDLLNQYKGLLKSKEKSEIASTNELIESCNKALSLKGNPIYYRKNTLGDNLISRELRSYPIVNKDETMLFYSVKGEFNKFDIYYSKKSGDVWDKPVKITMLLGAKDECYPSSVSHDNERLYLTVKTMEGTDIYCSYFKKDKWQRMTLIEKPINSSGWDSQASESPDGKYLYFSSDRKGGLGNMDLYMSEKDEKGGWKKPVNLGAVINTPQNELMPMVSNDNTKLFFKSEAHENVGGYDIFVSERAGDNVWGQPINIGYPLNTTDDDIHFIPVRDGNFAYMALNDITDKNKSDIYLIEIFSESHPRMFDVSGLVIMPEGTSGTENAAVQVIDNRNFQEVITTQSESETGNYNFQLKSGSYSINYTIPGYKTYSQSVELPMNYPDDALIINAVMEKEAPVAAIIPVPVEEPTVEVIIPEPVVNIEPEAEVVIVEPKIEPKPEPVNVETIVSEPALIEEPIITKPIAEPITYPAYEGKYTVQFMASLKKVDLLPVGGKYLVEIQKGTDGYYRYITGVFNNPEEAEQVCSDIKKIRYRNAFIREYNLDDYLLDAARGSSSIFTIQLMAVQKEVDVAGFRGLTNIKSNLGDDKIYRYTTGEFSTLTAAQQELKKIINKGFSKAFIKKTVEVSNYR